MTYRTGGGLAFPALLRAVERPSRVDRLLDYAWSNDSARLALCESLGFVELSRTDRGWPHRG